MKAFKFYLLFFIVKTFTIQAKLTLQDCQHIASENSEKICIADLHVLMEKDRLDETLGQALPQLSFHGDYVAAGEPRKFLKKHKAANAKASLIVPIYNFGASKYAYDAQKTLLKASKYEGDRVGQELIYAVSQAYYRLLESQKIELIIQDSVATLNEQLRISKDFYSQGLVHNNDVLLIEIQKIQRQQDSFQANHNKLTALARLNRLLGLPQDELTEIEDDLKQVCWSEDLNQIILQAKEFHPDLLSLQAQIKASKYTCKSEKGSLYPSIYAFSDYSTTNDYSFPYTHGINAGIGMQINLYDGGVTLAKIRREKKRSLELTYEYQGLEQDIELKIRSAYLQVENAARKIPLALAGTIVAEENLKIILDQFQEGLITTYELLNDEERLAEARSNYYQALCEFHIAYADLFFAAGIIQE